MPNIVTTSSIVNSFNDNIRYIYGDITSDKWKSKEQPLRSEDVNSGGIDAAIDSVLEIFKEVAASNKFKQPDLSSLKGKPVKASDLINLLRGVAEQYTACNPVVFKHEHQIGREGVLKRTVYYDTKANCILKPDQYTHVPPNIVNCLDSTIKPNSPIVGLRWNLFKQYIKDSRSTITFRAGTSYANWTQWSNSGGRSKR